MKSYYIFRHGQTYFTKNGLIYGDQILTAPILEEAKPVTERFSAYIKNIPTDLNVSSELLRCTQTTKIITEITGKVFSTDKRLNEFFDEPFTDFAQRIKSFLDEIEASEFNDILVCTHGGVMAGFKHWILNNNFPEEKITDYPNPGVLMIIKQGKVEEIDFN